MFGRFNSARFVKIGIYGSGLATFGLIGYGACNASSIEARMNWYGHKTKLAFSSLRSNLSARDKITDSFISDDMVKKLGTDKIYQEEFATAFAKKIDACKGYSESDYYDYGKYVYTNQGYFDTFNEPMELLQDKLSFVENYQRIFNTLSDGFKKSYYGIKLETHVKMRQKRLENVINDKRKQQELEKTRRAVKAGVDIMIQKYA